MSTLISSSLVSAALRSLPNFTQATLKLIACICKIWQYQDSKQEYSRTFSSRSICPTFNTCTRKHPSLYVACQLAMENIQEDHQYYNTVYDRIYNSRPRSRTLSIQAHYDPNPNPYYSSHIPSCGQDRLEYYRNKAKLASARVQAVKHRSYENGTAENLEINRASDFRQRTTSFSSYFTRRAKQLSRMEDTEQFWNKYRRINPSQSTAFGAKLRQFLFSRIDIIKFYNFDILSSKDSIFPTRLLISCKIVSLVADSFLSM